MCQFGDSLEIIDEQEISQENAIKGYRAWYLINPFNDKEKFLRSLNQDFNWPKNQIVTGSPTKENSEGIYNNNYYYNNSYYYYYYNYYNYNYYNYDHGYYIYGSSLLFGKVFSYKDGYRSSLALPFELCILSDKQWFNDSIAKKFAEHFNNAVESIAKEYNCKVIGYDDWLDQVDK